MLRSIKNLEGYKIKATDGEIGKVYDFYFDDVTWNIRYIVVDTGNWLNPNLIILSPDILNKPDWKKEIFSVNLTKDKIQKSPAADFNNPISQNYEEAIANHYGWPLYWTSIDTAMFGAVPLVNNIPNQNENESKNKTLSEYNLRSTAKLEGYKIHANDGTIGHIEDFIVDDEIWSIRYIVVDTGKWLPGKKVLVAIQWINKISWNDSEIYVDLSKLAIEKSPEFNPKEPVNQDYEGKLFDYYGKQRNKL